MSDYMLVTRGNFGDWKALSSEDSQKIMAKYNAFVEELKKQDRFKGGSALKEGSFRFKSVSGSILIDGPYAETKETITGYLLFEADTQQQAADIAKQCPALTHGESVELLELT